MVTAQYPGYLRRMVAASSLIRSSLFVFALILALHGAFVLLVGVRVSPDAGSYSRWADWLVAHGFDYPAYIENGVSAPYYLGFVTIVALTKVVFGSQWMVAIVLLNLSAESAAGVLLVRVAAGVTGSHLAAWSTLALYLAAFEIFNWTPFVLSDPTFLLVVVSIFYLVAKALIAKQAGSSLPAWGPIAVITLVAVFYRPPGIVLPPIVMVAFFLWWRRRVAKSLDQGLLRRGGVIGALCLGMFLVAFAHAYLVQDPARWPFRILSSHLAYQVEHYRSGEIVIARFETYHAPPASLLDYVAITGDRYLHYFSFVSGGFSRLHNLLATIFFAPTYLLAAAGLFGFFTGRAGLNPHGEAVVWVALLTVLAFSLLHALFQVDFDWRYRVPIMPHLIFLAALGVAAVQHGFAKGEASPDLTTIASQPERGST